MKIKRRDIILIHLLLVINIINCTFKQPIFKCEHNIEDEMNPLPNTIAKNSIKDKGNQKRRINDADNGVGDDGFKSFNIFLDLENIKQEISDNGLSEHEEFFTSSMQKAVDVLKALLKVKPLENDYCLTAENFGQLNISKWNTEIFGNNGGGCLKSQNIDLVIFGKIEDLGDSTLATASAKAYQNFTNNNDEIDKEHSGYGQPYVGLVKINKKINYTLPNSQDYFVAILIHEFTHILGFSYNFFQSIYKNATLEKTDIYGFNRAYLKTPKLLEFAKKYFNCTDLDGVELEYQGGTGTAGSHWEARILLGEYMNGYSYSEEMVISEFTLAVLEDSGFYKANYYTGGLMRYGKNKGCDFLTKKCIDPETHKMNENFENEFYDSLSKINERYTNDIDAACSSGRQSRAYKLFYKLDSIEDVPSQYRYYENQLSTAYEPADYCPVPVKRKEEEEKAYFSGHCSSKGKGFYGEALFYNLQSLDVSSAALAYATGETLGDHSFCFLSSIIKPSSEADSLRIALSQIVRANCYEIFCSSQSLTLKIFDDYVVCPRAGGKIKVEGYEGYLLCPDYNLMCSGSVICNDFIDCVNKQSVTKESNYDYTIKTSQNIEKSKTAPFETDNYELSTDGTCPQNCKQCKENNVCVKCRDDYELVLDENGDSSAVKCLSSSDLTQGYFKNETTKIYQKCMDNCLKCTDKTSCQECQTNYRYIAKQCVLNDNPDVLKAHCLEYDSNDYCVKCEDNYGFKQNDRSQCLDIATSLSGYYSRDNGISFYPCSKRNGNCSKCYYDETVLDTICIECINNLILLEKNKGICKTKEEIENDKKLYMINDTHAGLCSKAFDHCLFCDNDTICTKCLYGYKFVEKDFNENEIRNCINKSEVNKVVYGETENESIKESESSSEKKISRRKRKKNSSSYFSIINIFVLQTVCIFLLLINF